MHAAELTEKFSQYSHEMLDSARELAPETAKVVQHGQGWQVTAIGRSSDSPFIYNLEQGMWLPDQTDTSPRLPSQLARFCMESFDEGRLTDRKRMITLGHTEEGETILSERDLSRAAPGQEREFILHDSKGLDRFFTRYFLVAQWAYAGEKLESSYPY